MITDSDGQWYYYNHKLTLFYKNIKNETLSICSIRHLLCSSDDAVDEYRFAMENGDKVILTYKKDQLYLTISGLGYYQCKNLKWITPYDI